MVVLVLIWLVYDIDECKRLQLNRIRSSRNTI
jgi:hypothetical protein